MLKAILRVVAFVVLWLVFLFIGMGATTWFSNHSVTGLTDPQQIKQVRFAADLQGIGLVFPLSILIPALIAFKPRPLTIILAGSFSVLSHYLLFPSAVMFAKQHQLVIDHVEASRALNPHGTEPITAQQRAIKSYPELAIANSKLNQEFIRRYHQYQKEKPAFFDDPEWPTTLARECQAAVLTH